MITQDRLKELLHYDQKTGIFTWNVDIYRTIKAGKIAGTLHSDGCIPIKVDKKLYKSHRLAFLYMEGNFPYYGVDHIDGNRSNNSWDNLRLANQHENMQNSKIRIDNKSGYIGVSFDSNRNKWSSSISSNNKKYNLGRFSTPELAYEVYKEAKLKLHTFQPFVR